MYEVKWNIFNDDNTDRGIEGKYTFIGKTLVLYVKPTNSGIDWITDLKAWAKDFHGHKCHAGYVPYAEWLEKFIETIAGDSNRIIITGFSMGGGIAQLMKLSPLFDCEVFNLDGPKVCMDEIDATTYQARGSVVYPGLFWFKGTRRVIKFNKWTNFISAHGNVKAADMVSKIIEEEVL